MKVKQTGLVMIFSLILLLVMTLVGVSAVQQNKMQFLMASSTRAQTEALSNAENILVLAEEWVTAQRQPDVFADNECIVNADGKFTPLLAPPSQTIPLNLADVTASITACVCMQDLSACSTRPAPCLSELYTIELQFTDDGGAVRTVESLYAVRCEVGRTAPP